MSCGRASAYGYLEGRILAQSIQVVTVLVSCCNGHGSGGDHVLIAVSDTSWMTIIA